MARKPKSSLAVSPVMQPLRRIYMDIPEDAARELDRLARIAGQSKRVYVSRLILREAERAVLQSKSGVNQ